MKRIERELYNMTINPFCSTVKFMLKASLFTDEMKKTDIFKNSFFQHPAYGETNSEWSRSYQVDYFNVSSEKNKVCMWLKEHSSTAPVIEEIIKDYNQTIDEWANEVKEDSLTFDGLCYSLNYYLNSWRYDNTERKPKYVFLENFKTKSVAKLSEAYLKSSMNGPYLYVGCRISWLKCADIYEAYQGINIVPYDGKKSITEVGINFLTDEQKVEYIARGKELLKYSSSFRFCQFEGEMFISRGYFGIQVLNVNSRVIIDTEIGYKENQLNALYREDDCTQNLTTDSEIDDETYLIFSPMFPAFDLKNKRWGHIDLTKAKEIQFRTDAIENLIINDTDKYLLTSISEIEGIESKDIIDGKGGGAIFLLHGTPGVGKTLTAEAIAETQHKPLYMVSVGELGTEPSQLEERLKDILALAEKWNAILLIDEVDIFLEKRDTNNIHRNAMVGIFLRTLEYYSGILFLTTNRINNIDPAFYSRVSLSLHYPELSDSTRTQIWKTQFGFYNITTVDVKNIQNFCDMHNLLVNGRQIKNTIRLAYALARKENRVVDEKDIIKLLTKIKDFEKANQ